MLEKWLKLALLLNVVKVASSILFGAISGSLALIVDGLDSAGNIVTSYLTYKFYLEALRPPDAEHPYGHARFEVLAAVVTFSVLMATSMLAGYHLALSVFAGELRALGSEALPAAVFSFVADIVIYSIYRRSGRKSIAGRFEEKHALSDLAEGAIVLIGVVLALGVSRIWDVLAGVIIIAVCVYTLATSYTELKEVVVDVSPGEEVIKSIQSIAEKFPSVREVHKIRARKVGYHIFLDMHVLFDPDTPIREAHRVTHLIERAIKEKYPEVVDVVIHIEPFDK